MCAAQTLEDLDISSIDHQLEKINTDISIADLLQDTILAHVKEKDEEKEEDEHHSHHRNMLATRKELTQQLTAARVHEQVNLAKTSIGAFIVQPTIAGYGVKTTLEELGTQLTDLKALAHPLKDRPELMDTLQAVTRYLTTLLDRYDEDNPESFTSVSKDSRPIGMSKFDRLPRIELPSFNGENVGWRPYWEKFNNELKKDPIQQYTLRLQGRTVDSPTTPKPFYSASRQWKPTTLHVQKEGDCTFCHDGNHPLYLCAAYKAKSVEDRSSTATRLKLCTNCLSYNHFSRDCPSLRSCRFCGNRHHSILHRQRPSTNMTTECQPAPASTNTHAAPSCNTSRGEARVVLQVTVKSRGRLQKAQALLDSGSHMSFMTSRLSQSLKVKKIREPTRLTGISQTEVPDCPFKAELSMLPDGHPPIPLKAVIITQITSYLARFHLKGVRKLPFLQGNSNFDQPGRIDMLLGADILDDIMLPGRRSSDDRTLMLWRPCLAGPS